MSLCNFFLVMCEVNCFNFQDKDGNPIPGADGRTDSENGSSVGVGPKKEIPDNISDPGSVKSNTTATTVRKHPVLPKEVGDIEKITCPKGTIMARGLR